MATLKISELSVGDWVSCEDVYCKVAYILPNGIIGSTCRNYRDGYEDPLTNLRPIPITTEILEKNGFESSYSCWRIHKDNGGHIEIWEDEDKWYLSVNCVEFILCDLYWVHQIQHLMRVWGFDKEINL